MNENETCRHCDEDINGVDDSDGLVFLVDGEIRCEESTGQHEPDRDDWKGKSEQPGPDVGAIDVDGLWFGATDAQSRYFDYSGGTLEGVGEADRWNYIEAQNCQTCGRILAGTFSAECPTCESSVDFEGPMTNYFWPAPTVDFTEEVAAKLIDLPLCLVEVDGETGLALTGGGMDLSWEIASAYMVLGQLPPSVISLPRMSGYGARPKPHRDNHGVRANTTSVMQDAARTIYKLQADYPQIFQGAMF